MNNQVLDALDYCLHAIQDGASVDAVLARYPDLAGELRPLLETARQARELNGPGPSAATIDRTRARLLQRAAQMRTPRRASVIPLFQRLAFSTVLASVLLLSGTGLVKASSATLPGDNLYPVKRTWEDLRLLLVFSPQHRDVLESEYEQERLDEVSQVLQTGRTVPITFSGLITSQTSGQIVVSGVPVAISNQTQFSGTQVLTGAAVIVTGETDALGQVAALGVQVLPAGSLVPVGEAGEYESEGQGTNGHSSTFHLEGTVNSIQGNVLVVDNRMVYIDPAQMPALLPGDLVEVKGYFTPDGRFFASEVELEHSDLGGSDEPAGTELDQQKDSPEETQTGEGHSEGEKPADKPEVHNEVETPESGD
jgi:hypothetical protein